MIAELVWFVALWLNACVICAAAGLTPLLTVPLIFTPLAVIMWARSKEHTA